MGTVRIIVGIAALWLAISTAVAASPTIYDHIIDLGTTTAQSLDTVQLPVYNPTSESLSIGEISASCGCMIKPRHESPLVLPGTTVTVAVNLSRMDSTLTEPKVSIHLRGGNLHVIHTFSFQANLIPVVGFLSDSSTFVPVDDGNKIMATVLIAYPGKAPALSVQGNTTLRISTEPNGALWRVTVIGSPDPGRAPDETRSYSLSCAGPISSTIALLERPLSWHIYPVPRTLRLSANTTETILLRGTTTQALVNRVTDAATSEAIPFAASPGVLQVSLSHNVAGKPLASTGTLQLWWSNWPADPVTVAWQRR